MKVFGPLLLACLPTQSVSAQGRLVLIDHDGSGPGGSNQMAINTRERQMYMDVDLGYNPSYGEILIWTEANKPFMDIHSVHAQTNPDLPKLGRIFVKPISATTPK